MWHLKEFLLAQVGYLRRKYLRTCPLAYFHTLAYLHTCKCKCASTVLAHLRTCASTCALTHLHMYLRICILVNLHTHLGSCVLAYLYLRKDLCKYLLNCTVAHLRRPYLCIYTHAQVLVQALAQVNLCTCALAYLRTIAYLRTWVNTVDLVIFACFNFREFVILKLFASSSFREFSIVKKKSIVIKII